MSEEVLIARAALPEILERLSSEMDVWVPAEMKGEKSGIRFDRFRSGMVPIFELQSTMPPKNVVFPQAETLLRFSYKKGEENPSRQEIHLDDSADVPPALVFGARPCDVRGFLVFDRVYLNGPYPDPYYQLRRDRTLFATLACETVDSACFCSSVGSGPGDREGSDLWITSTGDAFMIEAITERGKPMLAKLGETAGAEGIEAAGRVQEEIAGRRVGEVDLGQQTRAFEKRFSDAEYWQEMVPQCISCGICTYLCPTCYCFTISDEMKDLEGERLRSWDACMFYYFTSEASGHNPRPSKFERYRNRIGHKFSYFPEKYDGMVACCGCGRCIRSCPVSIDIRRIVQSLEEEADA